MCGSCAETVYGLGANALDESAVLKIFEFKGRPLTGTRRMQRLHSRPLSHTRRCHCVLVQTRSSCMCLMWTPA